MKKIIVMQLLFYKYDFNIKSIGIKTILIIKPRFDFNIPILINTN